MGRLIDADAVKNIIRSGVSTDTEADQEYVCERIDEAPSIEIVRCRECKRHGASLNDGCVYCTQLMWTMNADDFCSYGEREGE